MKIKSYSKSNVTFTVTWAAQWEMLDPCIRPCFLPPSSKHQLWNIIWKNGAEHKYELYEVNFFFFFLNLYCWFVVVQHLTNITYTDRFLNLLWIVRSFLFIVTNISFNICIITEHASQYHVTLQWWGKPLEYLTHLFRGLFSLFPKVSFLYMSPLIKILSTTSVTMVAQQGTTKDKAMALNPSTAKPPLVHPWASP